MLRRLAALLGLVVFVGFGLLFAPDNGNSAYSNEEPANAAEDLTVSRDDLLPAQATCESDEFIPNSLPSTGLLWSDSVSTPFVSSDANTMLNELFTENCGNPTVLAMNIEALSTISVEEGVTIGDINPWMGEFVAELDQTGMTSFLTKKEGEGDLIFVTSDFQEYAALTNTVLLRPKVIDVVSEQSLTNWHIPARSGLAAGELPRAALNSVQESLPSLRLEYTFKGGGCLFAISFNTADKRFETLVCGTPPTSTSTTPPTVPPTTPPSTPPPTTPPTVPPTTPPTTPPTVPPTTPPTTPPCPPTICLVPKDRADDPPAIPSVTPQGPGIDEPTAPVAPAVPLVAGGDGSDTGTAVPAQEATPAPVPTAQPTTDPLVVPAPPDPGTVITDPDA